MFASSKTILLISDETLSVYTTGYKGVRLVETVPWGADNFVANVSKVISKDCGAKPIVILNDMVEQHYRKERVPRVGIMDKSNVVKRKLNHAFPSYPLRAALPLKEKLPKTDKAAAANVYIFAASPSSEAFQQTMDAARKSLAPITGFCLLPIESASMVKTLAAKLSGRGKGKAKWAVFLAQHRNGGLRQIVIKNGEIALTRMTPISVSDVNVEQWASDVHQEFQATLSYMARFGFAVSDGLDVIILSNDEAKAILENSIETECNLHILGANVAAKNLGISLFKWEEERYADALHVGWIAKKGKLALPMQAKEVDAISKPRQVATLASLALLCGTCYLGYEGMNKYAELMEKQEQLDSALSRQAQLDAQYQREVQKKEALGFDVRLVQSAIAVHEDLESEDIKALKLLDRVGNALGREMRIDQISIDRLSETRLSSITRALQGDFGGMSAQEQQENLPFYEAVLQISYPTTTDVDRGNDEIKSLRDRLVQEFPGQTVEVQKFLKDTEYVDELVLDPQQSDPVKLEQDFVASISIRGGRL